MARCVSPLSILVLLLLALAGCGRYDHAERPAWRDQAEAQCLAEHRVEPNQFLQPARAIEGPGICGLNHPFKVYALAGGTVRLNSASLLDCSMIPALDEWIRTVVQPNAQARFGEPVVQINTMGTYSCRGINNMSSNKLSEHAFANAMDIGGFVLQSGRELNVMRGWKGADEQESAFLHDIHAGACSTFTTVLGPGANIFHYNHIHVDLAMHGGSSRGPRRYCKPVPQNQPEAPRRDNLPDAPDIEEEQDMANAPLPAPSYSGASPALLASAPETPAYPSPRPRRSAPTPADAMAMAPSDAARVQAPDPEMDLDQLGTSTAMGDRTMEGARPSSALPPDDGATMDDQPTSSIRR